MEQQARNMTMEEWGCLRGCRYLLHDRDAKFCQSFRELIKTGSVNALDSWEELLIAEIERQQKLGKEVVFRADAAFAKPDLYEALEKQGVGASRCCSSPDSPCGCTAQRSRKRHRCNHKPDFNGSGRGRPRIHR